MKVHVDYVSYIKYVVKHKWYVFVECWKRGMYLHAFTHDLSKFLPSEFFYYAQYFYGGNKTEEVTKNFVKAWSLHYKRNKHHWEHWARGCVPEKIPEKYINQIIADWAAMSRVFGDTPLNYYMTNKAGITLHPETRQELELRLNKEFGYGKL